MIIYYYSKRNGLGVLVDHKKECFIFYKNADDILKNNEVYETSDLDIQMQADISVVNLTRNLEKGGYKQKGEKEWAL